jgi:hypothetical protein
MLQRCYAGAVAGGQGPERSDWIAAAVARTEQCILITTTQKINFYSNLIGNIAIAITEVV